ncbi:RNA polymerase II associated protein 2 [Saguinus oedipus]|uniref:RNA polymerase II subunit B1 CTD phosphatase RPAP2 homolog n=1 Tax=Saguinus oedipus TaxID=9490 RepID=A0ABQ9VEB7_SAGOE|nr:RNA polymerase II associated protein 2 [Saguinus oedipus]
MADCSGSRSASRKAGTRRRSRNAAVCLGGWFFEVSDSPFTRERMFGRRKRAELEAAVRKKIEFERKALHIVEQLLEENITEEFLMECGKFITPAHYSDVVDERSIVKLCGYPLCQKKLGTVPKQKYKISTKTNKVYDITERKSYFSLLTTILTRNGN